MAKEQVHVYRDGHLVAVEEYQVPDELAAQRAALERKGALLAKLKERAAKGFSSAEVPTVVKEIVNFLSILDT